VQANASLHSQLAAIYSAGKPRTAPPAVASEPNHRSQQPYPTIDDLVAGGSPGLAAAVNAQSLRRLEALSQAGPEASARIARIAAQLRPDDALPDAMRAQGAANTQPGSRPLLQGPAVEAARGPDHHVDDEDGGVLLGARGSAPQRAPRGRAYVILDSDDEEAGPAPGPTMTVVAAAPRRSKGAPAAVVRAKSLVRMDVLKPDTSLVCPASEPLQRLSFWYKIHDFSHRDWHPCLGVRSPRGRRKGVERGSVIERGHSARGTAAARQHPGTCWQSAAQGAAAGSC
jgi:hypothetical protein